MTLTKTTTIVITCVISTVVLTGCSSAPTAAQAQTGFLSNYEKLQPVEGDDNLLKYRKPDLDVSQYGNVMFERSELMISPVMQQNSTISLPDQEQLGNYFSEQLAQQLGNQISLQGEGRTVKVRGSFTGITNESKDLEPYQYIPVALLVNGIKEAKGERDKVPVMYVEFEATDEHSGELLAQVVRRVELSEIESDQLADLGVEAIKPSIDAEILRVHVDLLWAHEQFGERIIH